QLREDADEHDIKLIKKHFDALHGKAGALVIKMRLERESGVIMNHKKIRRLMRKYKLVATIRQANPYRKLAKATQEHQTCPNLLQRQFDQGEPEKVLLTDITYMYYGNGQCAYLSVVKDRANKTDFSSLSFFFFKASIGEDYFETTVPTSRWQHSPRSHSTLRPRSALYPL
ncbi:IS3 family transposase, partial [Brevibacillus laterosporus]|uniref:IS3 family transposase n=1 Tax=Brevibacillus laterosporus TaxID=1465 RepID=UPI003D21413C